DAHMGELIALIEFDPQSAPTLPLGQVTHLTIQSGGLVSPIETEGSAILRTDSRTRRCYSFRLKRVSKALLMLLANRRISDRLRPPAARPACVRILDVAGHA